MSSVPSLPSPSAASEHPPGCQHAHSHTHPPVPYRAVPHHHDHGPHHHHGAEPSISGRHPHRHDHAAEHRHTSSKKLSIALLLTASFMVVEAAVGWLSGSLTLVADAGHMLSDAAALMLALVAQHIARRPRSHTRTFGSRRAEVLAAFVNGIALAATAVFIVREAFERLLAPHPITGQWMLATAITGLFINIVSAWVLGAGGHDSPNTRAAFMHVLSDALGSVGAIVAAILVMALGWTRADPVISVLIAGLILWGAWRLVRETAAVLMEGAPAHVDVHALQVTLEAVPGVKAVHDLHVWTISDGFDAVTAHIVLTGKHHATDVVTDAARHIREQHGIEHVTLQPEAPPPGLVPLRVIRPAAGGSKRDSE